MILGYDVLFCIFFALVILSLVIHIISQHKKILNLKTQIIQPKKSVELSEFLSDMKQHDFGFVRVDPDSLLMRSPRQP
tara:strand:+ start:224 stop:457 length:234 start_codon:yes stop_codon:yes gene_type:complete